MNSNEKKNTTELNEEELKQVAGGYSNLEEAAAEIISRLESISDGGGNSDVAQYVSSAINHMNKKQYELAKQDVAGAWYYFSGRPELYNTMQVICDINDMLTFEFGIYLDWV